MANVCQNDTNVSNFRQSFVTYRRYYDAMVLKVQYTLRRVIKVFEKELMVNMEFVWRYRFTKPKTKVLLFYFIQLFIHNILMAEEEIIMMNKTRKTGKRLIAVLVAIGIMSTGAAVFAAEGMTPADIAAKLTGKTVVEVQAQRVEGDTYGTIAKEADKLEEFKTEMLISKEAWLKSQVEAGKLTQTEADTILADIKEAQLTCTGDGQAAIGKIGGANFGGGMRCGLGLKDGSAAGGQFGRNSTGTTQGTARGAGMGGRGMNR